MNKFTYIQFQHALEDQLHFFVEECDHLQGFHLLADWDTGFGAVASAVAQEIRDEFGGGKGLLTVLSSPLAQPLDKVSGFLCAAVGTTYLFKGKELTPQVAIHKRKHE